MKSSRFLASSVVIKKGSIKGQGFLPCDLLVKVRNIARNNPAVETLLLAYRKLWVKAP